MSDTPTAHLVLTVPPAIAAAWDRLEPEAQAYWSRLIVKVWLRGILEPKQVLSLPTVFPLPLDAMINAIMLEDDVQRFLDARKREDTPHA